MAADLAVNIGQSRFLQLVDEVTWGVVPGSPVWVDVPVTDFNVRFKPKRRSGQSRVGLYQRRYGANPSGNPSGNLVMPLFGWLSGAMTISLAQWMLEWGFLDQEVKFPRSKAGQWEYVAHEDDKGFTGLRVNSMTVAGSDAGIVLTAELIGNASTNFTGTATLPTTRNKLVEMLFEDAVFKIAGTTIPMSAFSWAVNRSLSPIFNNSATPTSMPKTNHVETLSFTPLKSAATYDALRDALGMPEMTGQIVLKGLHNGTGTTGSFTVVTIDFARLSLIDSDESGGTGIQMNPLTFDVLKPDTSPAGSVMTWTEA